jgi:hypothetical protein
LGEDSHSKVETLEQAKEDPEDTEEETDEETATKEKATEEPVSDNKATEEPEVVNETNEKWRPPKSRQIAKREARYQRKTARRHMAVIKTMQKIRIATTTQRVTMTKIQTATSLI